MSWALPPSVVGLAAGLAFTIICPPREVRAQEPIMRVLVEEAPHVRLRADGEKPLLVRGLPNGVQRVRSLNIRGKKGNLHIAIDGGSGGVLSWDGRKEIRIRTNDLRGIWLGKRRYRGDLLINYQGKKLQVVNHLGIEKYLVSVVGSEMPKDWPMAALKAQAVAARTYALKQKGSSGLFDVKATELSQVYKGVESETKTTKKAVRSTRSLVLVHKGRLIHAVFHSSAGGITEASEEVWGNQLPYLVSVLDHDHESPYHQWEKPFEERQLRLAFKEIGGVNHIEVIKKSNTGRVRTARVQGPYGELLVTGKDLRRRLGLNSTFVRFEMSNSKVLDRTPPKLPLLPNDNLINTQERHLGPNYLSSVATIAQPKSQAPPKNSLKKIVGFGELPDVPKRNRKRIAMVARGFGRGHGVGMSQWGANALAQRGQNFREILNHYYTGAKIYPYGRLRISSSRSLQNIDLAFAK